MWLIRSGSVHRFEEARQIRFRTQNQLAFTVTEARPVVLGAGCLVVARCVVEQDGIEVSAVVGIVHGSKSNALDLVEAAIEDRVTAQDDLGLLSHLAQVGSTFPTGGKR